MRRLLLGSVVIWLGWVGFVWSPADGTSVAPAVAKAKAKSKKAAATPPPSAAGKTVNACGCYADGQGRCFCGRKGKCACPGECEPKGCEAKRAKEMDKEVAAETKKAAAADRKQQQESSSAAKRGKEDSDKGGKGEAPSN